jgi:hypothetical protein
MTASVRAASVYILLAAVCARRPPRLTPDKGGPWHRPIWQLPPGWKAPSSLVRTGFPIAPSPAHPCCNTPCPTSSYLFLCFRCPFDSIRRPTPSHCLLPCPSEGLLTQPGTEPHERSAIPDTVSPKASPCRRPPPISFFASGLSSFLLLLQATKPAVHTLTTHSPRPTMQLPLLPSARLPAFALCRRRAACRCT